MANSFKMNKQGLDQLQKDLQKELNKRPVTIPVRAESPRARYERPAPTPPPAPTTTVNHIYNGPVVNYSGDGNAQLAFSESGDISQSQENHTYPIAEGYDELATVIADLRAELAELGLTGLEGELAAETVDEVLTEVATPEPDQRMILKAVNVLKGTLTAIASGVDKAISAEAAARAAAFITQLGAALPF
jgi:hypothetical protein